MDCGGGGFLCSGRIRKTAFLWKRNSFSLASLIGAASFRRAIMKWFSVLLLAVFALFSNACEMHPASELPPEEEVPGETHAEPVKAEAQPAAEAAPAEAAKPAPPATPGEAPKFFPDKK